MTEESLVAARSLLVDKRLVSQVDIPAAHVAVMLKEYSG
jgi:hypothetical protein